MGARETKQNTTKNFCRMPAKNDCKLFLLLFQFSF